MGRPHSESKQLLRRTQMEEELSSPKKDKENENKVNDCYIENLGNEHSILHTGHCFPLVCSSAPIWEANFLLTSKSLACSL